MNEADVTELVHAAENVLACRGWIATYPPSLIERTERIPESALNALAAAVQQVRDGEEDKLYKTARTLLDFYDEYGVDEFKRQFGNPGVLDVCRQIVAEGEGNPHPWS